MKTPLHSPCATISAPPTKGVMNLPLPGCETGTCETKSVPHTPLLLLRPHPGNSSEDFSFPSSGGEGMALSWGQPRRTSEAAKPASQERRRGWGWDSPLLIFSRRMRDATGSFGVWSGVSGFWLQGQLETSPQTYKTCLGEGAPDDMVPHRSLSTESQRLGEAPAGDLDLCSPMLTEPRKWPRQNGSSRRAGSPHPHQCYPNPLMVGTSPTPTPQTAGTLMTVTPAA